MAIAPHPIRRRVRSPGSGLRMPPTEGQTQWERSVRDRLHAALVRLDARDQEFARSLLAARRPTTRQLWYMECLIARTSE